MEGSKGNKVFFGLYTLHTLPVYIADTGRHSTKLGFFCFLKQYHQGEMGDPGPPGLIGNPGSMVSESYFIQQQLHSILLYNRTLMLSTLQLVLMGKECKQFISKVCAWIMAILHKIYILHEVFVALSVTQKEIFKQRSNIILSLKNMSTHFAIRYPLVAGCILFIHQQGKEQPLPELQ